MELLVYFQPRLVRVSILVLVMILFKPIYGQISTPCSSASMITSFAPCMNFVTNSSANGTSPTADCCNVLKSLTSSGLDCLCLIVTASVPFQLPINRTLALSLPRACNMPAVPIQCKASGVPIPAPAAPESLSPTISPEASPAAGPKNFESNSPVSAPGSDTTPLLTPPSSPTATTGSRKDLIPSAGATPLYSLSPSILLFASWLLLLKLY